MQNDTFFVIISIVVSYSQVRPDLKQVREGYILGFLKAPLSSKDRNNSDGIRGNAVE